MEQVSGTYDGEGSNTTGAIPCPPALNAPPPGTSNGPETLQGTADTAKKATGRTSAVRVTRNQQLRVSSESSRSSVAINFGSGDQVLTSCARGLYVSTSGTLVLRCIDDTADQTFVLSTGYHPLQVALIRNSGSSGVVGQILF